jgi:hypothetical protein
MQAFEELTEAGGVDHEAWDLMLSRIEGDPRPSAYQSPEARKLLDRYSKAIEYAVKASRLDHADFGARHDEGYMTLLPHLGPMRDLSKLMILQSNVQRANGRIDDSASALASVMRLSRHSVSDGTIINSLVGMSCSTKAFESLEMAIAHGDLGPSSARIILGGISEDDHDPFGFGIGVGNEFDALEKTLQSMNYDAHEFTEMLDSFQGEDDPEAQQLRDMDPIELSAELDRARAGFELGTAAFDEPDPVKADAMIAELERGIDEGRYGMLASIVMPDLEPVMERKRESSRQIARYSGILKAIAGGEDPARFANAAVLYAQAFPALLRTDADDQELLNMVRRIVTVTGSCEGIPGTLLDEVRGALEQAAAIIGTLRSGARFERCEWPDAARAERFEEIIGMGDWVRPMRASVRLLLAEAAMSYCLAEAGVDGADEKMAASLADAMTIAIQLGDGSHLMSSAASAAAVTEVADFAETALSGRTLDDASRMLLEGRFSRLIDSDPLGWSEGRESMIRPPFLGIVMRYGLEDPELAERLARNWNTERLISIAFYERYDDTDRTEGVLPPFPRSESSGELFEIGDFLELDEEQLSLLATPHTRLLELLELVDRVEPVKSTRWQARGEESLSRLSNAIREIRLSE